MPAAGLQKAEKGLASEDLEPGRVYKPLFSAFGSELAFLDSFVAFPFQVSLPRQLENVRLLRRTVTSASKELIKEAGEGLWSLKTRVRRSEQPLTAQHLSAEFSLHMVSVS